MEEYRLTKEYKLPPDIIREGCRAYQKKYVYPKSWLFIGIFLLLAADFIHAAVKDPDNYFAYILIVLCLAFAFREWYNPRKARRSIVETAAQLEDTVYRISVAETYADIATVSAPPLYEEEPDGELQEAEPLPDPTRLTFDSQFSLMEHDSFFLMVYGKSVYYIVPKEGMTEEELAVMRQL